MPQPPRTTWNLRAEVARRVAACGAGPDAWELCELFEREVYLALVAGREVGRVEGSADGDLWWEIVPGHAALGPAKTNGEAADFLAAEILLASGAGPHVV